MITSQEIDKLAALSRIKLTPEEKNRFQKEIDSILSYIDQIKELGGGVDEKREYGEVRNVFREDESPHQSGMYTDSILKNAPEREGQYVKVKKIL